MAENLNYLTDSSWCYWDIDSNCAKYGRLYALNAARTACPAGWHLPSLKEWDSLALTVKGKRNIEYPPVIYWNGAGRKLKAKSGWYWNDIENISGNGTDDFGFSALPGGHRHFSSGHFFEAGEQGDWWTAESYHLYIHQYRDALIELDEWGGGNMGYSVRCVGDKPKKSAGCPQTNRKGALNINELAGQTVSPAAKTADAGIGNGGNIAARRAAETGKFTDTRDGKTYKTVKMPDGKTWMAENLNYKVKNGSWCHNNNISNCNKYGRLYNWNAAITVCSSGWHLPSRQEWADLTKSAGDSVAGKKLKATSGWRNNNGNGTDEYNFTALPGGIRIVDDGGFRGAGIYGFWWTATKRGYLPSPDDDPAYSRGMGWDFDDVSEAGGEDDDYAEGVNFGGLSVRCVQDAPAGPAK
jgi:uncharacterized protein (TIGR02145 family)